MNIRELVQMLLMQFFICYTCTMIAAIFFCRLNTPPIERLPVDFLWQAVIFSLCAVLPGVVYLSRERLTRRQLWMRTAAHTVLLEIVLLTAGRIIGMYQGIAGFLLFAVTILVVDLLVRLFTYLGDRTTAVAINQQLEERRKGQKK